MLRLLLARGADLRAQDRAGTTALALAVRSADVDVVRFLVERGLNPDALNPGARRAALARNYRPDNRLPDLEGAGAVRMSLFTTATWEPPELLARAIDAGADVNASNAAQYGRTPLLTAVASEAAGADTLKLLLDRGADPNIATTEGETPLDWAIYKGDRAKIQLLEQRGAMRGNGPRREEIRPAGNRRYRRPARLPAPQPRAAPRRCARLSASAPTAFPVITTRCRPLPRRRPGERASRSTKHGRARISTHPEFFTASMPRMMLGDPAVGGEALTAGYVQVALARETIRSTR